MKCLVTGGSGFIGTNLIEELVKQKHEVINIDIKAPNIESHTAFWTNVDILNRDELLAIFKEFMPTHVIHLAARTDTDGTLLDEYLVNTNGTENVLYATKETGSIKRVVITSTQFVNQYKGIPTDDFDFAPHTIYGESKVISEQMTRQANLQCIWTIIRPTNIWGPWHKRYPHEFWKILGTGKYLHPGNNKVIRSYGYVKNVVYQINAILNSEPEKVASKVYYVGDEPIELLDWVNGFSIAQTGRKVRIVPAPAVKLLAIVGDVLKTFHIRFPITRSRYKSMTTSNETPLTRTIDTFGTPPYNLQGGIDDTVAWLRLYYPEIVKTK